MMAGFTIDDLISGSRECSLTEEDVVAYVRGGDPTERDWNDWPLKMPIGSMPSSGPILTIPNLI